MYWIHENRILATSPKVASQSMTKMLGSPLTRPDLLPDLPVTLFVRDPIDRLVSAYKQLLKSPDHLINYEGVVDAILSGRENMHWVPQMTLHASVSIDEFVNFEDMPVYFRGMGVELPHLNKSTGGSYDVNYRLDEIRSYYQNDFEVRQ